MRVFIGVGHGGADPGAVANGLLEKDVNLAMALACKNVLESYGVEVGISRVVDEADKLAEEIAECNAFAPDVAVEVHNNAGGGDGFEAYVQTNAFGPRSRELALAIEARVKDFGQNSRGIKTKLNGSVDWFGWLREVKCPAVLLEGFFLDSADHEIADTIREQESFGAAYAMGILDYLGIEKEEDDVEKLHKVIAEYKEAITQYEVERNKVVYLVEQLAATLGITPVQTMSLRRTEPPDKYEEESSGAAGWQNDKVLVGLLEEFMGEAVQLYYTDEAGDEVPFPMEELNLGRGRYAAGILRYWNREDDMPMVDSKGEPRTVGEIKRLLAEGHYRRK